MASVTITPWRKQGELLNVRDWLFPRDLSTTPRSRRKACSQIQAWKLRGSLPHAIESTWYIIEAILTDDIQDSGISALAKRACYCTTLSRFVTGLVDSEQDSKYKVSMYDKAKELQLPASLVELRHESIHGELPSLVVLRQAAERSLAWLWNDYWRHLGDDDLGELEISSSNHGQNTRKDSLRATLQTYLTAYREASKATDYKLRSRIVETTALELLEACRANRQTSKELARILVDECMILQNIESQVMGVLWDPLLLRLAESQGQILALLTDHMIAHLVTPRRSDITEDAVQKRVLGWLTQVYTAESWGKAARRAQLDDVAVVSTCLQNPNRWSIGLATAITMCSKSYIARDLYGPLVTAARGRLDGAESMPSEDDEQDAADTAYLFDGWQQSNVALGRPIGVL
ncbi:MAG: hypothetical protein Q9216_003618 [Gyalolechia sp. 2 TL-2023]